jgi:peptidoglycan/xylan/chitin deacetylase (PgdA/CDA1 family)
MRPRHPYPLYFRHPFTHTGDTREKKEAIEAFLGARGYAVAPHTIDSEDYLFNVPYARALAAHDSETAARLRAAYVAFVLEATGFAERVSPLIFGREIPQTILLHANAINADVLEELLGRLEARGYRFVPLEEAMADAAYRTRDTFVTRYGPTWLWRWTKSLGLAVSFAEDPEPPGWVTERPAAAGPTSALPG